MPGTNHSIRKNINRTSAHEYEAGDFSEYSINLGLCAEEPKIDTAIESSSSPFLRVEAGVSELDTW